uniref:Uncharacterized protein n=1 Tax=Setaria italica TaxID=4555 RepID=K3XPK6_SETIT
MSSTAAAAGDVLPALPPIRTAASQASASAPKPACSLAASSSTASVPDAESVVLPAPGKGKAEKEAEAGGQDQVEEPTTPTLEASRLRALAECPPATRKPAWAPEATPPAAKVAQLSAAEISGWAWVPCRRLLFQCVVGGI